MTAVTVVVGMRLAELIFNFCANAVQPFIQSKWLVTSPGSTACFGHPNATTGRSDLTLR